MKLPEAFKCLSVSPEFVRDNQYKPQYTVIDEYYDAEIFNRFLQTNPHKVCYFPSGKRCFFLLCSDVFTVDNSPEIG